MHVNPGHASLLYYALRAQGRPQGASVPPPPPIPTRGIPATPEASFLLTDYLVHTSNPTRDIPAHRRIPGNPPSVSDTLLLVNNALHGRQGFQVPDRGYIGSNQVYRLEDEVINSNGEDY